MCLTKDQAVDDLVRWGSWHWKNAGYGENLGFSSDGNMHHVHLATAACGGGNKVDYFEEMPADVAYTDAQLTMLGIGHYDLCKLMFLTDFDLTVKQRIGHARPRYMKKYEKSSNQFKNDIKSCWIAVCTVLDKPKISAFHPYRGIISEKTALQGPL